MPEYLAPGTYVEEVRGDVVPIQGVSTSTAGFVGLTERGPTQTMLITSWPEYLRWYGDPVDPAQTALPLSVQGFFANGGERVYIARITGANAVAATTTLASSGVDLVLTAIGGGEWGNRIAVRVLPATKSTDRFRLQVAYFKDGDPTAPVLAGAVPTVLEDYDELSVDVRDARYVLGAVNAASHLIKLEGEGKQPPGLPTIPSLPENPPDPKAPAEPPFTWLTTGTEGTIPLTAADFVGHPEAAPDALTGLSALAAIDDIAILAVPDAVNKVLLPEQRQRDTLVQAMIEQCEQLRDRVVVLDVERGAGDRITVAPSEFLGTRSDYAAIYYPHVRVLDPRSRNTVLVPPSGFVAGIYAHNDVTRGVHKAPANYEVRGILTRDLTPTEGPLEYVVTKGQHAILNPFGINVIRDFRATGQGIRVWGARTTSSDPEWIYVNVRRLFNYVEESVDKGLQWVVFEPNAEPTWARVRRTIETFLERVWRDGALMGTTREEAFFVRCDRTTMSTDDILNGRLICLVGLAAVRPAEFVILRFQQMTVESAT
jgi:uncharacterized protein